MSPFFIVVITAGAFGILGFLVGVYMCRQNERQAYEDGRAAGWLDGYKEGEKNEKAWASRK